MVAYNKGECNPSTVVLHSDASRGSGGKPRDERFLLSGAEPGYETSARCSGWHAVENSSTVFVTFHFTFSDCILMRRSLLQYPTNFKVLDSTNVRLSGYNICCEIPLGAAG